MKSYGTDRPLNACAISPLLDLEPSKQKKQRLHVILGGGQAADQVTTTSAGEGKFQAMVWHMVRLVCVWV